MKRKFSWFAFVLLLLSLSVYARAYQAVSRNQSVACADFSNFHGRVDISVDFHRVQDDTLVQGQEKVSWSGLDSVFVGSTQWVTAATYAQVSCTMSVRGSALQIYTDNTNQLELNSDLETSYDILQTLSDSGTNLSNLSELSHPEVVKLLKDRNLNCQGLFPVVSKDGQSKGLGAAIPLAWRISDQKLSGNDLKPVTYIVDGRGYIGVKGADQGYYPWFYMQDLVFKYQGRSGDMGNYSKLSRAGVGLQTSQSVFTADADKTHYLYFAADFSNAKPNTNYKAYIIVEAFIE